MKTKLLKLFLASQHAYSPTRQLIQSTKLWWIIFILNFEKIKKNLFFLQVHNGPPHNSNFGYSYAKRMIDVLNRYKDLHHRLNSNLKKNLLNKEDILTNTGLNTLRLYLQMCLVQMRTSILRMVMSYRVLFISLQC